MLHLPPSSHHAAGRLDARGPSSRYILPQFEERTSYGLSLIHI